MTPRRVAARRAARRAALPPPGRAADASRRGAVAEQLCSYLDKYSKALIVHADNVGSNQLMMIRKVRPRSLLLFLWRGRAAGACFCAPGRLAARSHRSERRQEP